MLVYYFPEKKGAVYIAPVHQNLIMMDSTVVGTDGLVKLLEDRCGIYHHEISFNRRMCRWYEIMKPWLDDNKENILYKSYSLNQLSMAKQMLKWRDDLRMAGWDFSIKEGRSRLGALAAIEQKFDYPGLADRLIKVTAEVKKMPEDCFSDIEISLPYEKHLLHSLPLELINVLEKKGVKVRVNKQSNHKDGSNLAKIASLLNDKDGKKEITLNSNDPSFRVLEFKSRKEEEEYLVVKPPLKNALWIVSDNKSFDNRLEAHGKPATGSEIITRSRITGLLKLIITLYLRPLDIRNIVEWLSSPYNPLPAKFRYALAEEVASTGGYNNPGSKAIVEDFISGKYVTSKNEEEKIEEISKKKIRERTTQVEHFIPYFYRKKSISDLQKSLDALSSWASRFTHHLKDEQDKDALLRQFNALVDGISNLQLLMHGEDKEIEARTLLKWCDEVIPEVSLRQYPAMIGGEQVVTSPGDIAMPAEDILWLGLEGMNSSEPECSFLLPGERDQIKDHAKFTDPQKETEVKAILETMPFQMAENSLTITFADKRGGEDLTANPLLLRLKCQIKNLEEFITSIEILDVSEELVEKVDNKKYLPEFKISDTSKINFPQVMSASSLDSIIYNPFDFFFERILGIKAAGMANLPGLEQTKGTVAHNVIAALFNKSNEENVKPVSILEKEYDQLFDSAISEAGAILMLPENLIDTKIFKMQLQECLENLIDIIENNNLRVVECEGNRAKSIGITEGNDEGNDLTGFMDMILEDEDGKSVVFDFKWSTGWYYRKLLDNDRSLQLAVYSELLKGLPEDPDSYTAYFFMPKGELVTRSSHFKGSNIKIVGQASTPHLFVKIVNSYRYRRQQILNGALEGFDGGPLEKLQYHIDTVAQDLLPLVAPDEDEIKKVNGLSAYGIFKGI